MTDQQLKSVWVVIPAAGSGQRMQSELPKQYIKVLDKTIIEHTLDCFLGHKEIAGVVVVISDSDDHWQGLNLKTQSNAVFTVNVTVKNDSTRSDSVMQGLKFLYEEKDTYDESWVMVHDAARPCLSRVDIDALLAIRDVECVGGILASPVRDTMKRSLIEVDSNCVSKLVSHTESRENLWHALTPQMFRLGDLTSALQCCQDQGIQITDECSAMENRGEKPVLVTGSHNNIKVTYPSDIELVSFLISQNNQEVSV